MIFGGLALCVVVLAVGIDRVTVDNSLKGNFSAGSPVRLDDVPLNAGMGGDQYALSADRGVGT